MRQSLHFLVSSVVWRVPRVAERDRVLAVVSAVQACQVVFFLTVEFATETAVLTAFLGDGHVNVHHVGLVVTNVDFWEGRRLERLRMYRVLFFLKKS